MASGEDEDVPNSAGTTTTTTKHSVNTPVVLVVAGVVQNAKKHLEAATHRTPKRLWSLF